MKVQVIEWFTLKTWTYAVKSMEEDEIHFTLTLFNGTEQCYYKGTYSYRVLPNKRFSERIDENRSLSRRENSKINYSETF